MKEIIRTETIQEFEGVKWLHGLMVPREEQYKAVSQTFIKGTNIHKHAGRFSQSTIHYQGIRYKTYKIWLNKGIPTVGENTRLYRLVPMPVVRLLLDDEIFDVFRRRGHFIWNGKEYEYSIAISKSRIPRRGYEYTYTEQVCTDNDFEYIFPEY